MTQTALLCARQESDAPANRPVFPDEDSTEGSTVQAVAARVAASRWENASLSVPFICRIRSMKVTHALVQVVSALMADPQGRHWGYDLSRRSGVRSGVLYPILHRLLEEGWLSDGWEDGSELNGGRPPRRYYELTEEGIVQLGAILRKAEGDSRFGRLAERLA